MGPLPFAFWKPVVGGGANPLATGVIAAWHLDEASGTRYDSGPNGFHLDENNTPAVVSGKLGNSIQTVMASNQWLKRTTDDALLSIPASGDFTIACWVWLDDNSISQHFVTKSSWDLANKTEYTVMYHSASGCFAFIVWDSTFVTGIQANADGSSATGAWNLLIAEYDYVTKTASLSQNGGGFTYPSTFSGAYVAANPSSTDTPFTIGRMAGWNNLSGKVDEVVIWHRKLTGAERTELWNGGAGKAYPF